MTIIDRIRIQRELEILDRLKSGEITAEEYAELLEDVDDEYEPEAV